MTTYTRDKEIDRLNKAMDITHNTIVFSFMISLFLNLFLLTVVMHLTQTPMIERFKSMSEEDRKLVLADAFLVEEETYTKTLTDEELIHYKDLFTEKSIEHSEIETELKGVKANYKARLEPIKTEMKRVMTAVQLKAIDVVGKLYTLVDRDNKTTYKVDEQGNVIYSRPMFPEEGQYKISENQK